MRLLTATALLILSWFTFSSYDDKQAMKKTKASNNTKEKQPIIQGSMTEANIESSFYNFKIKALDGKTSIDFSKYKGKKILIVNVASECGFTPQYKPLQELHEKHGDKLVVLGFPANNFGAQEPGSNEQIAKFCQKNYGVSFQMFTKISVKGSDQHPLYQWLQKESGKTPNWNFCKYLVDEKGKVIKFYPSSVDPMGKELLGAIEAK
ncbi:glutathione peroxidase [Microscilla marina]|uniref:Glutathione peroxidase n=1 Tax=Microscilla marina ATCC 23134 TaxID=313606 RepID=A1ZYW6_MICM2|nr:glutathione peroxidase [Microscilla marina]EAY24402.1 glutathione peroxidase 2 [Microscilla marina ATCC 23134]